MNANELRIGNLIYRGYYNGKKDVVEMLVPYFSQLDRLEPIPITEEWLVKLGFSEGFDWTSGQFTHDTCKDYLFTKSNEDSKWVCGIYAGRFTGGYHPITYVTHLHELQNLFFALTGEELTNK